MEGLGTFQNAFASESLPSIGWDGMAVSLLGLNNPIGILFSALVFAILRIGGISMPLLAKIPTEVVSIVVAFIIFFVGANYLMEVIVDKFPHFGKRKVMRNGFSNTFTSSCREHAHLLNTADFNSFRGYLLRTKRDCKYRS